MTPARLTTRDPIAWERTTHALADTATITNPLEVRCKACGALLARMADTDHGPLFTSSWEVPARSPVRVVVDGKQLNPRAQRRFEADNLEVVTESGPAIDRPEVHGTIGLLALPAAYPQDYPDFMVRCVRHGDAVVDRIALLKWLREGTSPRLVLDGTRIDYEKPEPTGDGVRQSSSRTTRQGRTTE